MRVVSCPRCGNDDIQRSARKGPLERLWGGLTGLRPYRCQDCNHRFWRLRAGGDRHQDQD